MFKMAQCSKWDKVFIVPNLIKITSTCHYNFMKEATTV